MSNHQETAAICGLFCGTCPSYPNDCQGCLSSKVAAECQLCGNGFRDCAQAHQVTRCYECDEFPCIRLHNFSQKHIVNGICHHQHVIEDLEKMKTMGVKSWVEEQIQAHTCTSCHRLIPWYERSCPNCNR